MAPRRWPRRDRSRRSRCWRGRRRCPERRSSGKCPEGPAGEAGQRCLEKARKRQSCNSKREAVARTLRTIARERRRRVVIAMTIVRVNNHVQKLKTGWGDDKLMTNEMMVKTMNELNEKMQ